MRLDCMWLTIAVAAAATTTASKATSTDTTTAAAAAPSTTTSTHRTMITRSRTRARGVLLTVIARTERSTATAARRIASATAPTSATVAAAVGHLLQEAGDLLSRLGEQPHQPVGDVAVLLVEERGGRTEVAHAPGTPNAVHVLLHLRRQVEVDHLLDVGNVETAGGNGRRHQDRAAAAAEQPQGLLALVLRPVAVDAGNRVVVAIEELLQRVGRLLRLDEDQRQTVLVVAVVQRGDLPEQVQQVGALDVLLHPEDRLRDVDRGRTDAPDGEENVAVEKVARQLLDRLREGGGEHERLTLARHRHLAVLDDAPDLRLEAHVQHPVGLVQHQEADVVQPHLAARDHVLEATGRRHDQMAAAVELAHLVMRVVAAVQHRRAHARPVAELLRLLEDLRGQLARRRQHQPERVLLAPVHRPVGRRRGRTVLVHLVQNRHQEGGRLARAGLRARHQVAPGQNDRDCVLLHRRRLVVARQLHVVVDDLCQLDVVKGIDVAGHVVTRRLHGNIFVLAEIDTGVAVFEQLRLQPLVPLGELCVVHLAAAESATAAAAAAATSTASASVTPVGATRPATSAARGDLPEQVQQVGALDVLLHPEDRLRDVDRGRTDAPDGEENVAVEKVARQLLDRLREGGGEHERLTLARHRHLAVLDDAPDLRLEAHVQHPVGLVQHQEADVVQPHLAARDHVLEATGRRHDQMAAAVELAHLVMRVVAAVQHRRAHARPVAELLRLLEDLRGQLARRRQHQPERVLLAPVHRPVGGRRGRTVLVHLVQNRHQEGGRLARAGLRARHQVAPGQNDRDCVLLHRRRLVVARQLHVVVDDLCQLDVVKGIDVAGHVVTRRLHGNIFVLAEIDTGVAVFEQLRLQPLVPLGELCVVHLAAAESATAAAAAAATSSASASVTPVGATRPATSAAVRSAAIVERATSASTTTNASAALTGPCSSAAADATRSSRRRYLRTRSGLRPAIARWGNVHRPTGNNSSSCRPSSCTNITSAATVRRPVVPPIASVTLRILIAPAAEASVAPIIVAPVATAAAIAEVTAPTIVLVPATAASASSAAPIVVPAAEVVTAIVVAAVVAATSAIAIRVAESSSTAAATYRTAAGAGLRRLNVAATISTLSQLGRNVPPGRMFRISRFWAAAPAAAKLLLLLLQVQTSKLKKKKTHTHQEEELDKANPVFIETRSPDGRSRLMCESESGTQDARRVSREEKNKRKAYMLCQQRMD
uniref:Uncharacterized protein n=1 Tax=Anopheles atroparvus TaxID=41427 RepID=A0A182JJJ6_ANOAO